MGAAPRDAEYRFYLGRLQQEMGQYSEAVASFRAILVYHPRHLATHFFLGKAYSQLGQQGNACFHLGLYYYGKGQREKAKFQLEKALSMTTDATRRQEVETLLANMEKAAGKKKTVTPGRRKR